MFKKIAVLSLVLAANSAFADDKGKWLCTWGCEDLPLSSIDARNFVSVYVNQQVWIWQSGDMFSICNGSECQRFITLNYGISWFHFEFFDDDETEGYKGEGEVFW